MARTRFLNAEEAAAALKITRATLYAYVSRGLIRSQADEGDRRVRRYLAEDVERLAQRRALHRAPRETVEQTLEWGLPLIESKLTLISDGRLFYRGQDALALAQHTTLEEVAALLWGVQGGGEALAAATAERLLAQLRPAFSTPIERMQAALLRCEMNDAAAYDLRPAHTAALGARLLPLLAAIAVGQEQSGAASVAATLQQGWLPGQAAAIPLLNAALILCADHELNVSSFTARVVASAGGSGYGVVLAGLAALKGTRHGGHTRRVAALLSDTAREGAANATRTWLERGGVPGFGHRLYPGGDPRARTLLTLLDAHAPQSEALAVMCELATTVEALLGDAPTIDFALVALAQSLALPPDAPLILFALGRTVGWLAHAIEQQQAGYLIRPRARYSGKVGR